MPEIPNFTPNPELEELLDEDLTQLEFDTLIDVQKYKSKKLQAKRDAGVSEAKPDWSMVKPGDFGGTTVQTTADQADSTELEDESISKDSDETSTVQEKSGQKKSVHGDNQIEYYNNLKSDLKAMTDTEATSSTVSTEPDPDRVGDSDETSIASETDSRGSQSRRVAESPALSNFSEVVLGHIRDLEQKLDDYHQLTLELKDEIAELREKKARLEEQ